LSWVTNLKRIKECKRRFTPRERLTCLIDLYNETHDGMVTYALGEELESQGELGEALRYYEEAERRLPIPRYKLRVENAMVRVKMKIGGKEKIRKIAPSIKPTFSAPTALDFQNALQEMLSFAEKEGKKHLAVVSGDLHRVVGGYPGPNHRMPICCNVMKKMMQLGDEILYEPPKGQGATLTIKYYLGARESWNV